MVPLRIPRSEVRRRRHRRHGCSLDGEPLAESVPRAEPCLLRPLARCLARARASDHEPTRAVTPSGRQPPSPRATRPGGRKRSALALGDGLGPAWHHRQVSSRVLLVFPLALGGSVVRRLSLVGYRLSLVRTSRHWHARGVLHEAPTPHSAHS